MSIRINLENRLHDWEKQNSVTQTDKFGMYDLLQCRHCEIKAKRYGLQEHVFTQGKVSGGLASNCTPREDTFIGIRIQVRECSAKGPAFKNITPKSIHRIVPAPKNYVNGGTGCWVMGTGEPVMLLWDEFTFAPLIRKT